MQYAETAVLIDVMNGDLDAARGKLADFMNNELLELEDFLDELSQLCSMERAARNV
jgi:hypothetical protein